MKQTEIIKKACRDLKSKVRFENASFTLPGNDMSNSEEDTELIRRITKLYTESWVIPIIDAIEKGETYRLKRMLRQS